MIVYAASDLHGNLPDVPRGAELLLLAGDICPDYGPPKNQHWGVVDESGSRQLHWLDNELRPWLREAPCPIVATWGNHDFIGEHRSAVDALRLPWTLLIDREATIDGVRIWGTTWVPHLPRWAFHALPEVLHARSELIPSGLDILMTHGPPYRVGDRIPGGSKYGNLGEEHVGDDSLNDAILTAQPKAVVCGHIHEARGRYAIKLPEVDNGGYLLNEIKPKDIIPGSRYTWLYNVAAVDELYDLRDEPFTRIDL
jgi:Icc-related predicted phosphoesterase